ncbi:MAG: hypothetical protein PHQ32_00155 [Firmicutes bacterium]|nr:hypothetical protein [Bacillota bacterium]
MRVSKISNVFKGSLFIFFLIALLSFSSCSDKKSASVDGDNNDKVTQGEIKVLSDYPEDFMPLYKVLRVNNCTYEVKDDLNYVFGKDIYIVEFESSASKDELADYYKKMLDSVDEENSYDEYNFEGLIGEQKVDISISDEGFLDALGTSVYVAFGVPKSEYADENKYFIDYPKDLIEMAFASSKSINDYREDYYYHLKRYTISYVTTETPDKVIAHYHDLYSSKDNYKEEKDEYGTDFSWKDGEYNCSVSFSDSVGTDMLLLTVEKDM